MHRGRAGTSPMGTMPAARYGKMKEYLLGIDVGTTGTKTLLMSEDGIVLGHSYRDYPIETPAVGFSEQKAQDWWKAVTETVREVSEKLPRGGHVAAISLSLQGGTIVPVDAQMEPLRNAIVWNDGRCAEQFRAFQAAGGSDTYAYERSGWHMSTGLPALQVRWIRDHEPEIFEKTAMFLSVPDYVSMKMTGKPAVDLADAGINQFCDIRREKYDDFLMEFAGIREEQLAPIVHTGDVIGHLTPEAAAELGLDESTVLVAGAHDQYAVAVGGGANSAGDVMIGSGTAWVVTGISDAPAFESGLAQSVAAVPGKWGSIFSLSSGGVCLDWLRRQVCTGLDYGQINEETAGRNAAENGLFFFPFQGIAGAGKRFSRASFTGMDMSHDRFDLVRACMEGVVFQTRWMMESFDTSSLGSIRLAGGASKSQVWSQMIADIMQLPVHIPALPDLACVGAAVIAGKGAGIYSSIADGCRALGLETRTLSPNPAVISRYENSYRLYKQQAEGLWNLYQMK